MTTPTTPPRRFYKTVDLQTGPAGGWQIALDGKILRSPAKAELKLPTRKLAEKVRSEWDAQATHIEPRTMPMMQLASTAIDRVAQNHEVVAAETAGYAGSDLICYRVDQPSELARRQSEIWQPLLDWANQRFDTALQATTGIMAITQSSDSLARYAQVVTAHDAWRLTALASLTGTTGSLLIALALSEGRLSVDEAVAAAQLDELYQAERWGEDAEAVQRRQLMAADIAEATTFLTLLA